MYRIRGVAAAATSTALNSTPSRAGVFCASRPNAQMVTTKAFRRRHATTRFFYSRSTMGSTAELKRANSALPSCSSNYSRNIINPRLQQLPQLRHQFRSMVMVTQTKVSDLPDDTNNKEKDTTVMVSMTNKIVPADEANQLLQITESCWKRIRQLVQGRQEQDQDSYCLRVFVDAGGCSGFTYQFELDTNENLEDDEDVVFVGPDNNTVDSTNLRVVVDKGSLDLIQGSTIDYVQEMIKSSFEVRGNPQSESACGCGSSFALKNFSSNPAKD